MNDAEAGRILVIGLGNEQRGDDAAGLIVARGLRRHARDRFDVRVMNGEPVELIGAWAGYDVVILIDTMVTGAAPGTLHRIDATDRPLAADTRETSSHALNLAQAIELARMLGELPARVLIYGVEGRNFKIGAEMSLEVRTALDELSLRVLDEVRDLESLEAVARSANPR